MEIEVGVAALFAPAGNGRAGLTRTGGPYVAAAVARYHLGLVALAAAALSAYGSKLWVDRVRALTRQLEVARIDEKHGSGLPARFDSRELEGLPGPVQRYFRAALTEGRGRPPAVGCSRQRWRIRPGYGLRRRLGRSRHPRDRDVSFWLPSHAHAR
jgi:hypothetical protein